jgi:hypothetical protein
VRVSSIGHGDITGLKSKSVEAFTHSRIRQFNVIDLVSA